MHLWPGEVHASRTLSQAVLFPLFRHCLAFVTSSSTSFLFLSRSAERSEDKMPIAAVLQPSALCRISGIDAEDALQDGQQDLDHECHLHGSIYQRFQELSGMERGVRGLPYLLGNKSTSARTSSDLRKSLVWDKAFSTNEGVLDVDELPLVDNSPRRPQELRPFDILDNHGTFSPSPFSVLENVTLNARAVDCAEGITSSSGQGAFLPECLPFDLLNSLNFETESSKGCGLGVASSDLVRGRKNVDIKASKFDCKRSVSGGGIILADVLKGTRLRVPSTFTGKRGKSVMLPKSVSVPQSNFLRRCKSSSSVLGPSSASSALSEKVSSVSKKVKDTLGRVLPGSFGGPAKHFKVNDDWPFHRGGAAKDLRTQLGHRLDVIGGDVKSPCPMPVARSNSRSVFFAGNSLDVNMVRQKDSQVDENNQEVFSTYHLGDGFIDPNLKDSSMDKDDGSSFKQCTEKKTPDHTQFSSVISGKRSERAGFQAPSVQNSNHVDAAQNREGLSSGLRLQAPKIGFFNTQSRPASGERQSTLPESILGGASDNSHYSRKGLPPRPHHGFPSRRLRTPCGDSNVVKVACQLASSGIPFAPHLRGFSLPAEGLVSSAAAPASPRRHRLGILSAASHKAVTGRQQSSQPNSDQSHSSVSELKTRILLNPPFTAVPNLVNGCQRHQSINQMSPLEVGAQGVMKNLSNCSLTDLEADGKFRSLGGDRSPGKIVNSLVPSTQPLANQYLSSSPQLTGSMEKICSDCRLQSLVEAIWKPSDSVFCNEKSGSINVVDELIISSSIEPVLDTMYHKAPQSKLGLSQEFERLGSAQLAIGPEFGICSGKEILDTSIAHPAREEALASGKCHPGMANLDSGRSLGHGSRLKSDSESEDSSKFSEDESSVNNDMNCCVERKFALEDSAEASVNQELLSEDFRNTAEVGCSRTAISIADPATIKRVQELSSCFTASLPKKEYVKRNKDNSMDGSSLRSDWPRLVAANKSYSQVSLLQEHTSKISPDYRRQSHRGIVTPEDIQEKRCVRLLSSAFRSDSQVIKDPLAVNVGLLNSINKTSLSLLTKDRTVQVLFDQPSSEITPGQENKRARDGQVGSPCIITPHQRNSMSYSSHSQSETYKGLFTEERIRALEAAGPESLLKKSGAVQHSPPNKISPNRNPWSPVKRSGQKLGPFDCTKRYTNVGMGQ